MGEYSSGIRNDIHTAMGDLRKDVKEELSAIRVETRNEFSKVREEAKISGDLFRSDFRKMEERLNKLESQPEKNGGGNGKEEGADRDLQSVASGWDEEKTEEEIVGEIKKFLDQNELQEKCQRFSASMTLASSVSSSATRFAPLAAFFES